MKIGETFMKTAIQYYYRDLCSAGAGAIIKPIKVCLNVCCPLLYYCFDLNHIFIDIEQKKRISIITRKEKYYALAHQDELN